MPPTASFPDTEPLFWHLSMSPQFSPQMPPIFVSKVSSYVYLITHFRLSFGNRIMKQIRDFIPCFIACGGTELDAIDFIVAKKVFRKFESLSLGFMQDELHKFSVYLDKLFGKGKMPVCQEYIDRLMKMS